MHSGTTNVNRKIFINNQRIGINKRGIDIHVTIIIKEAVLLFLVSSKSHKRSPLLFGNTATRWCGLDKFGFFWVGICTGVWVVY
jgi:hypothetical protein